jgi:cell division protein FtsB
MKKRKKSKLMTLIVIALICYFAYTLYNQQLCINMRNEQHTQLASSIDAENRKMAELKHQKDLINTDEFTEKIAREKLGYVKDGENIYVDTNK